MNLEGVLFCGLPIFLKIKHFTIASLVNVMAKLNTEHLCEQHTLITTEYSVLCSKEIAFILEHPQRLFFHCQLSKKKIV